jgi:hypothetical protein
LEQHVARWGWAFVAIGGVLLLLTFMTSDGLVTVLATIYALPGVLFLGLGVLFVTIVLLLTILYLAGLVLLAVLLFRSFVLALRLLE